MNFIFSNLGVILFGGWITDKIEDNFQNLTGVSYEDNYFMLNFNDLFSGNILMYNLFHQADFTLLILQYCVAGQGSLDTLKVFLFFYSYLFIIVFTLQNVLIGFILEFLVMFLNYKQQSFNDM